MPVCDALDHAIHIILHATMLFLFAYSALGCWFRFVTRLWSYVCNVRYAVIVIAIAGSYYDDDIVNFWCHFVITVDWVDGHVRHFGKFVGEVGDGFCSLFLIFRVLNLFICWGTGNGEWGLRLIFFSYIICILYNSRSHKKISQLTFQIRQTLTSSH